MLKIKFTDQTFDLPLTQGIVLRRDSFGTFFSNVPHAAVLHSPCGFEAGYLGSGPADLALNTVQAILVTLGYQGVMAHEDPLRRVFSGDCFTAALRLHQTFKEHFIASALADREAGEVVIPYAEAVAWVKNELWMLAKVFTVNEIDEAGLRDLFSENDLRLSEIVFHDNTTTGKREIEFAVFRSGLRFRIGEAQHLRYGDLDQVVAFVLSGREIVYVGACSVSRIS